MAFALHGCSTTSVPASEIAEAQEAVAAASRTLGDRSSEQLQRARTKIALAHRWVAAKDYRPARWLAEQARVDAELAAAELGGGGTREGAAE